MSSSLVTNSNYLIDLNSGANTLSITGAVAITGNLSVSGNSTLSGNILGDRIQNGTTSIDIQTANGNANITVGGTSNVAVFATTGAYVAGLVSVTGNITAGNLDAVNLVINSITSDDSSFVTVEDGLNVEQGLTVTGNINGANLNAVGLSLSGNVISAINMTTNITTTGNISANNITATTSINIAGATVATIDDAAALAIALG